MLLLFLELDAGDRLKGSFSTITPLAAVDAESRVCLLILLAKEMLALLLFRRLLVYPPCLDFPTRQQVHRNDRLLTLESVAARRRVMVEKHAVQSKASVSFFIVVHSTAIAVAR